MALIRVEHDLGKIAKLMDSIKDRQLPFATAKALTLTAKEAQKDTYTEFERKFDRPTQFTMKSLFIKPATKRDLTAEVFVKDRAAGGKNPNSIAQMLRHQFGGGPRIVKVMESALRRARLLDQGEFIVPGAFAKLDRYGNVSRGQLAQILSQIGVGGAGYDNEPTKSRRSKKNVAKAGQIFWSRGPGSPGSRAYTGRLKFDLESGKYNGTVQHLPKGAWMRAGPSVKPLLLVVGRAPGYTRRIDMEKIGRAAVAKHFNRIFAQTYREAVESAR